jgi:L-2-hydroxyglutarate oxidase
VSGKSSHLIIGAGLVGLATAYRLLQRFPQAIVTVLEKDPRVASQQSTHNSGVLHAGLYYKPGSEKARLSVDGLRQMVEFCREHGVPHEICGKIVVATKQAELPHLADLENRGRLNGLVGLRRLGPEQIREQEPHAAGIAALHVPQEGIVDYRAAADRLALEVQRLGGRIEVGAPVIGLSRRQGEWIVRTPSGEHASAFVVNCGGLHSDRLVKLAGGSPTVQIVPFRGEYFELKPERRHLVRNLIYPVPNPTFPFLGVHFTRMIGGGVEAGPNAVLAFAREGYRKTDFNFADFVEAALFPGLWRFIANYPSIAGYEFYRSLSKAAFCRSLQRLVPEITVADLQAGGAGVRAQAMTRAGRLVDDFHFETGPGILHVVNAPSPAATASLALGARIAALVPPPVLQH